MRQGLKVVCKIQHYFIIFGVPTENGITKSDIPQLFENNGKYLKEIMPKAIDRMNFENKFHASYEQVISFLALTKSKKFCNIFL